MCLTEEGGMNEAGQDRKRALHDKAARCVVIISGKGVKLSD